MVPTLERNWQIAKLGHATFELGAVLFFQPFFGDGTCSNGRCRQTCGRPSSATWIADAELLEIGVVRMAWAKCLQQITVVFAALVGVLNQQGDGRASCFAFINARKNLNLIGFVALRDMATGTWTTSI